MRVAIDTGGTFTDVLLELPDGRLVGHKRPSTPDDPGRAVIEGIRSVLDKAANLPPQGDDPKLRSEASDVPPQGGRDSQSESQGGRAERGALTTVLHGTTVGTNALLERRGARVLLVSTAGFEDVLELARQARPHLYALAVAHPQPLVAPGDALGVEERLEPDGSAHLALSRTALERLLEALEARLAVDTGDHDGVAVAVCLLHAYANGEHERLVLEAIEARFAGRLAHVCRSSEVLAELREYERASTTVANAFIAPRVGRYVTRLERRLGEAGEAAAGARLRIMQSNGGLMSASEAATYPIQTALSGPAGGVLGGLASARGAGFERVITFDMGGTSSDVGFCDARVGLSSDGGVGEVPVRIPMVDLHTVGAGGGSLARVDIGGALKVGPESAGALPGPACYGRGGTRPTVSDAHVVLGRLRPECFLGGAMTLELEAARRAVTETIAAPLGLTLEQAAAGILEVVDASMARAIRVMSVERGHVPERLALVAFGGAGALHGCALADAVGIPTVIVPACPGLLSAFGMLHADIVRFASRSLVLTLPPEGGPPQSGGQGGGTGESSAGAPTPQSGGQGAEALREALHELSRRCHELLAHDGVEPEARALEPEADVRYHGQSFELTVALAPQLLAGGDEGIDEAAVAAAIETLRADFEVAHERRYGYRMAEHAIELVTLRVRGVGRVARGAAAGEAAVVAEPGAPGQLGRVDAWFDGTWREVPHHDRTAMGVGARVSGPAIVTEYTATTVVTPGWTAEVAVSGALVLRRGS